MYEIHPLPKYDLIPRVLSNANRLKPCCYCFGFHRKFGGISSVHKKNPWKKHVFMKQI